MKATQQHNSPLIFTYGFLLLMTVLILFTFPFAQQLLEQLNDFLGEFLSTFKSEISKNYGL